MMPPTEIINDLVPVIALLIVCWLLWRYVLVKLIILFFVTVIGTTLIGNIIDTLVSSEYEYAPYLCNKYNIFRMKKQLGKLYINEPFIWTDEQAGEERRVAFEYATTIHEV